MIRKLASDPFENVATSLVVAKRTVVEYRVTFSTNQVLEPDGLVSDWGSLIAILSPMSNGLLTKIKRRPEKYWEDEGPNINENDMKRVLNDISGCHI